MKILDLQQGTDEWARVRATRFTASEAPAMMGVSKYQTRTQLLDQKSTGLVPDVDDHQQRIFDKGHAAEAAARPIAERIIGEDLYPVTCEDDEGRLLASMDGLTMLEDAGFEHKLWNEKLAEQVRAGNLEPHYTVQMDQQMLVSGAEKILFMCSDGTEENCVWMWYEPNEKAIKALTAGWAQFEKDLAAHKPAEAEQPKAEGRAPDALPALSVQVQGMVTASNLKAFEESARTALANIKTDLKTDNDFADAEKSIKFCKEVETRLTGAKDQVIGQMGSVDEVIRLIDSLHEEFRQKRLKQEKGVKAQKEQRKAEILSEYRQSFSEYPRHMLADVHKYMPAINADFAGVMKGLKTMTSIRSACDDELARAKIEANEIASVIRVNLQQIHEHAHGYDFLFNDFGQICHKPADDFAAIVKSRIADHREAEQKKLDAEREKIRQEEEAKAKTAQEKPEPAPAASSASGQGRENQQECEVPRTVDELMQTTANDKITISRKEYEQLVHNSKMYLALAAAGVDNWEGYDVAMEIMEEAA